MVGDATPHPVGYTVNGYTNRLDWRKELAILKAKNIKVYAVQAGCSAVKAARARAGDAEAGEEWACGACSMDNASASAACAVCASPKPAAPEPTANGFWRAVAAGGGEGGARFAVGDLATVRGLILAAVCKDMGSGALAELGADLKAEGRMTAELEGVYAVMTRTTTTTTKGLAAGGGGGRAACVTTTRTTTTTMAASGGGGGLAALASGGLAFGGGRHALLGGGGGGKAAPKTFDLDRDATAAQPICAYFLKGDCKFGDKCSKPHAKPHAKPHTKPPAPTGQPSKGPMPCKGGAACAFLRTGRCVFKHTPGEVAAAKRATPGRPA
jgi:hypothetical protein